MAVTIDCGGRSLTCASGGYCVEWDDGTCDAGCGPDEDTFERKLPTPLAQGKRRLRRLRVTHMRRGAVRQLLGGAVSDVPHDQELIDLTLDDVSVAEVMAALGG